jgi:hypothetical protein
MDSHKKTQPRHTVSIACWLDLYRYGDMMNAARFDPRHSDAAVPLVRLKTFQGIVRQHSLASFPTLVLNDGAVAYADIGLGQQDRVWQFIRRCWKLFEAATEADLNHRGVGLRGVIAVGLRAPGRADGIRDQDEKYAEIIDDLMAKRLTIEEAKSLARKVRRNFDIIPQLQANFAFTLAYLAETAGGKAGFEAGNLYLDERVFRSGVPSWMSVGDRVDWVPKQGWLDSLANAFFPIRNMEPASDQEAQAALRIGNELLTILRHR